MEKSFQQASQCYKLNYKLHGDYNYKNSQILGIQSKCYLKINDVKNALRYAEQKLKLLNEIFDGASSSIKIAKSCEIVGNLQFQLKNYPDADLFLERTLRVYEMVYSDTNIKTQNLQLLLARTQIKNERYREAVKTLTNLILEHNHKYIQTTKFHIDYYNDYKHMAIAQYHLDDLKTSIEHFDQAISIGSKIFIGINENC